MSIGSSFLSSRNLGGEAVGDGGEGDGREELQDRGQSWRIGFSSASLSSTTLTALPCRFILQVLEERGQ
jgi:hypothetical protein